MRELVVISGKGGTGKTSITACFAALAPGSVVADCDVDAADLHMLLRPAIERKHEFISGNEAVINGDICTGCGLCMEHCRFGAILETAFGKYTVDQVGCEGCGVCVHVCPEGAVDFPPCCCGEWYESVTRFGPMVHARLGIARENSGKLVSTVRREAAYIAEKEGRELVISDGPPGTGCPVIASITGASLVVVVTEPTISGKHDMARVIDLARHFSIPGVVVVNKWDINPDMTLDIEAEAGKRGFETLGRIPWDDAFTSAMINAETLIEHSSGATSGRIRETWERICRKMV
jgi:MinD superfamily P-loop ATPase